MPYCDSLPPYIAPIEFRPWPKIPRLQSDMVITEKIDGTNACVGITDDGRVFAQSRKRIITPDNDNFGFAAWVEEHKDELRTLGPGYHYGEWWGHGIQRGYGMNDCYFSLFNTEKYDLDSIPTCVGLVPVLYRGPFSTGVVSCLMHNLKHSGSRAAPGYMNPEGVVVLHKKSGHVFKYTFDGDKK